MAVNFADVFLSFQDFGLFEFFLPFLLIFSIVFAVLQKVKILGDNKGVHLIVSLVIGLLAVRSSFIVFLINNFLSNIALIIVLLIMLLVVMGLLGGGEAKVVSNGVIIAISLVGIFWALFYDFFAGTWILPEFFLLTGATQGSLLTILIFIVVILIITGGLGGEDKGKQKGKIIEIS